MQEAPPRSVSALILIAILAASAAFAHAWWPLVLDAARFLSRLVR